MARDNHKQAYTHTGKQGSAAASSSFMTSPRQVRPKGAVTSPSSTRWLLLSLVLVAAASVRLGLFLAKPDVTQALEGRTEFGNPSTSWKAVLKAHRSIWHQPNEHFGSPYALGDGEGVAGDQESADVGAWTPRTGPTPILLAIMTPLLSHTSDDTSAAGRPTLTGAMLFFTAMDLISTLCIYKIAALRLRSPVAADVASPRQIRARLSARHLLNSLTVSGLRQSPSPVFASAVYALNPLTVLACLSRGGNVLTSTLVLLSTWAAMSGNSLLAVVSMSVAGTISLHPLLLLPVIWVLAVSQSRFWRHNTGRRVGKRKADSALDWLSPVLGTAAALGVMVTFSAGFIADYSGTAAQVKKYDWTGVLELYQGFVLLPSLTPSLSLWWYFFVEIFEHFRGFFLLVFNVHLVMWTAPICIRFRHDALFALFLLLGVQSIFKPYPTAGDVALYLSLSTLFPAQASYLRTPLPTTLMYLYAALLVPSFAHLFLTLGSANANFLYAAGLVGSLGGILGWIDWAWAGGRYLWELEREAGVNEILEEDQKEIAQVKAFLQQGSPVKRTVVQL